MVESLFNKVACLNACNFIKKTPPQVFSVKFTKFLGTAFFIEHLQWLLLNFTLGGNNFIFIRNFIKDEIESFSNAEVCNDDDDNSKEDSMFQ